MRPWWRWWIGGRYGRGGLTYERLFEIVVATCPVSYGQSDSAGIRERIVR